jgi:hypothetical protein
MRKRKRRRRNEVGERGEAEERRRLCPAVHRK